MELTMRHVNIVLTLASAAMLGAIVGAQHRANQIQATCESDSALTVINGTQYVCLSRRQVEQMQGEVRRHGNET